MTYLTIYCSKIKLYLGVVAKDNCMLKCCVLKLPVYEQNNRPDEARGPRSARSAFEFSQVKGPRLVPFYHQKLVLCDICQMRK